jgi:ornithine cyclodeaminase/alanine dehydrogenase-like protein (mu-crystallin family)
MLLLSEQQVQALIDIDELIATLEQAHIQYSTGRAWYEAGQRERR